MSKKAKQAEEPRGETTPAVGKKVIYEPIRSAVPLWVAAGTWLVLSFCCPLYRIGWVIAAALVSAGAGAFSLLFVKKETRRIEIPYSSGNPEVDAAVKELADVGEKLEADRKIIAGASPETAERLGEIITLVGKICGCIENDPADLRRCRRFMNYYLPTTVKLADKYAALSSQGEGSNVSETKKTIEDAFLSIRDAFRRQHDALFADDALDISTDVTVLETMLRKDGLDGQNSFSKDETEENKQ